MLRSTCLLLLALAVQQSAARIIPTRVGEDSGRHAKIDAFMKFEAAEEDKLFFDRALAGHMMSASMSMDMGMSMPMITPATGTSSGTVPEVTPADIAPTLELTNTVAAADSSAAKAAAGISCLVGAMGMLFL
jgi:hypothetical protein